MPLSSVRRPLLLLGVIAALLLALAYQTRPSLILDMTAQAEEVYLPAGFYAPEQTFDVTFRWTDGDGQIELPGLGSGVPLKISLNAHAFRPAPLTPSPVALTLNGREVMSFTPTATLNAYIFDIPALIEAHGTAVFHIRSDSFIPKDTVPGSDDARPLGVFVDRVQVDAGAGLIVPPLWTWLLLSGSVLAVYAFSAMLGLSHRVSLLAALAWLAALVAGIIAVRWWLGQYGWWLAVTAISAWLVAWRLKHTRRPTPMAAPPVQATSSLAFIVAVFLAWRVALIAVPILGADVAGVRECCPEVLPQPLTSWSAAAFGTWYRWDAIWYGSIAREGYQYFGEREASNVGFFPGAALIFGVLTRVTGLPVDVSGPLASSLLTLLACGLLYRLVQRETAEAATAQRAVVYLLAFPAAYYLALGFSEALYLVCGLAAFLLARAGRWGWAGIIGFGAGLTRLHGALLVVPLAYEYARQAQWHWRSIFKPQALAVLGGPLGVLAFNVYLNVTFGQPAGYFSPYFEVQALFFKGIRAEAFPTFPLTTFFNYLTGLLSTPPSTESVAVMGALGAMLILTLEVWARLPRMYGVYMLTVTVFSLTSGDLISLPRFVAPLFPGFVALALLGKRPALDRAILVISLLLQGVLALLFVKGYWIA